MWLTMVTVTSKVFLIFSDHVLTNRKHHFSIFIAMVLSMACFTLPTILLLDMLGLIMSHCLDLFMSHAFRCRWFNVLVLAIFHGCCVEEHFSSPSQSWGVSVVTEPVVGLKNCEILTGIQISSRCFHWKVSPTLSFVAPFLAVPFLASALAVPFLTWLSVLPFETSAFSSLSLGSPFFTFLFFLCRTLCLPSYEVFELLI